MIQPSYLSGEQDNLDLQQLVASLNMGVHVSVSIYMHHISVLNLYSVMYNFRFRTFSRLQKLLFKNKNSARKSFYFFNKKLLNFSKTFKVFEKYFVTIFTVFFFFFFKFLFDPGWFLQPCNRYYSLLQLLHLYQLPLL